MNMFFKFYVVGRDADPITVTVARIEDGEVLLPRILSDFDFPVMLESEYEKLSEASNVQELEDKITDYIEAFCQPEEDVAVKSTPFFIFDVESIGLHGEGFAVAGGVYIDGAAQYEFQYCCPRNRANGDPEDREWIEKNVPVMEVTHPFAVDLRDAFWEEWEKAKKAYPGITMAAECLWPVEAGFVSACVRQGIETRKWEGPYPFLEISSVMMAAGMDPMATYDRTPSELPAHNPLADARLSARLLETALKRV